MNERYPPRRTRSHRRAAAPKRSALNYWPVALGLLCVAVLAVGCVFAWRIYDERQPQAATTTVSITGKLGTAPVVSLKQPLALTFPKARVVEEGSGQVIEDGSPVLLQLCVFDGTTGKLVSAHARPHLLAGRAEPSLLTPELLDAVRGRKVGSRLEVRRPVVAGGRQRMEIDVVDLLPLSATGKPVSLPSPAPVEGDFDAAIPTVSAWPDQAPTQLALAPIRVGEGSQVGPKDTVVANFGIWKWSDHSQSESTWATGPQLLNMDRVMEGLRQALPDQRVGSRLLVSIPAEQAQGDSALIVIVDILAITG